ncbi:hypothetical protein ACJMK2_036501 [Sinanodonta woodiana]|uniref:SRCR domain-containing protein n=1 Tax=Sinanodonta woodiana TaxID=1069815 RepID=A0ABD3WHR8_SINWO
MDKEIKSLDYKHMLLTLRLKKKLAYVRGIQKSLRKQREHKFAEDSKEFPFGVYGGRPLYSYRYEVDQIIQDKHPRIRRLKQVERYMANGRICGRIIDEEDAKRQFQMIMDDHHKSRPLPRTEKPHQGRVFGAIRDQKITPPPRGQDPVIANGIIYNLWHIPIDCRDPEILAKAEFEGAGIVISTKKAVIRDGRPYKIKGNIEIDPKGCLYIEPGTVFHFAPGRGIMVNGTLIARGSIIDGKRIIMTKDPDSASVTGPSSPWPTDARLVDGNITRDGRLELFYMGKWRGVCTNYNNYTGIDVNATCLHLGFVYGNFTYHSFAQNETDYMIYEKPGCLGSENSLFDCPGKNNFYNSTNVLRFDGVLVYNESLSWLEYLNISYAGLDILKNEKMRHSRASISASPFVLLMNNVTITNGAYDGLNLTEIRGNIHIANSTLAYNRGKTCF